MSQNTLTHKRLTKPKKPIYAQMNGVQHVAQIHSIYSPHSRVYKIIDLGINIILLNKFSNDILFINKSNKQ